MKKLLVPVITLAACLTFTYTTTAYASQEEANAQITPIADDENENYPFDSYTMPTADDENENYPFDSYNN